MIRIIMASALSSIILAGCNDTRPVHTAYWYACHDKEREARTIECQKLSLADRDADCVNADQGAVRAMMTSNCPKDTTSI